MTVSMPGTATQHRKGPSDAKATKPAQPGPTPPQPTCALTWPNSGPAPQCPDRRAVLTSLPPRPAVLWRHAMTAHSRRHMQ
jgi:hypothetical protein